jgi:hypothetical protein
MRHSDLLTQGTRTGLSTLSIGNSTSGYGSSGGGVALGSMASSPGGCSSIDELTNVFPGSRAPSTVGPSSTTGSIITSPADRASSMASSRLTAAKGIGHPVPAGARARGTTAATTISSDGKFAKVPAGRPTQKFYADATRRHEEYEARKREKDSADALDAVAVQNSDSD